MLSLIGILCNLFLFSGAAVYAARCPQLNALGQRLGFALCFVVAALNFVRLVLMAAESI